MICPLCRTRKAKRPCPGVDADICTLCCGTKRLVEIACPPTCVYLTSAQRHPAAMVRRQQEHDLTILMRALGPLTEPQLQIFFVLQSMISRFNPTGPALVDADIAEAAAAVATSFETAARGVLYEQTAISPSAEALRRELKTFLTTLEGGKGVRFEREVAIVLRGIERGARHEISEIGEGALSYLTLIARILHQRPPDRERAGSRIILP